MPAETVAIPAHCLKLDRDEMDRLPPSARRVLLAIMDHGPASLPELQERAGLPRRTVAFAIARLKDAQLVAWHQRLEDYRVRYFSIHPRLVHGEGEGCHDLHSEETIIQVEGNGMPPSRAVAPWLHGR